MLRQSWRCARAVVPSSLAQAREFFQQAVRLDPFCARAHAGLSFTHFQDAFLHHTADHIGETERAYRFAEQSVALDERDPTAHWVLGRALWLLKRQDDAVEELDLAVDLNPNFALGHYTIAFVQAQGGDTATALRAVDLAQRLSPIDPLLFGMLVIVPPQPYFEVVEKVQYAGSYGDFLALDDVTPEVTLAKFRPVR